MATYKIIGADGKEYGPITAEQLKQWIAEGRANQQTKVLAEGATEWKTVAAIHELATALPLASPTTPILSPSADSAADQMKGPAVGLIVTAILGFAMNVFGIVWNLFVTRMDFATAGQNPEFQRMIGRFSGTLGVVSGIVALAVAVLILYGALKMRKLESYGWAMTASILAVVPCVSPCCLVGLPIGIWALVVLAKPEVKSAFQGPG